MHTSEILGCLDALLLGFARPGSSSLGKGNFIPVMAFLSPDIVKMTFAYLQVIYHITLLHIIIVFLIFFTIFHDPFFAPCQAFPVMWGDASPATAESIAMQFELGDKGSATRLVASCAQGL